MALALGSGGKDASVRPKSDRSVSFVPRGSTLPRPRVSTAMSDTTPSAEKATDRSHSSPRPSRPLASWPCFRPLASPPSFGLTLHRVLRHEASTVPPSAAPRAPSSALPRAPPGAAPCGAAPLRNSATSAQRKGSRRASRASPGRRAATWGPSRRRGEWCQRAAASARAFTCSLTCSTIWRGQVA